MKRQMKKLCEAASSTRLGTEKGDPSPCVRAGQGGQARVLLKEDSPCISIAPEGGGGHPLRLVTYSLTYVRVWIHGMKYRTSAGDCQGVKHGPRSRSPGARLSGIDSEVSRSHRPVSMSVRHGRGNVKG
jgi:hypothetical protein